MTYSKLRSLFGNIGKQESMTNVDTKPKQDPRRPKAQESSQDQECKTEINFR